MNQWRVARIGLAVALMIVLVGGGVTGLVLGGTNPAGAQEETTTTVPGGRDEARARADGWLQRALQPLVDDGTIDATQRDAVTKAIEAARPVGFHGPAFRHGYRAGVRMDIVANTIGLSVADVRAGLRDGKSIADLAAEKDVDVQRVIDALSANTKANLDAAVAAGRMTQAEADQKLAEATEHLTDLVDRKRPTSGDGG